MGRVRITRLFVLLALAALLAPPAEASRASVWEPSPPASVVGAKTDTASALASLEPSVRLDQGVAAAAETTEAPLFDLGDVVLVERELEHEEHFNLGPLTLVDLNLLRGPPPSYPETRVRGFELLPAFRVGASPTLSLWPRQACGFSCREVVSDSRYDPWGLTSFREWVNEFADDAFAGDSVLKKVAAGGLFLADAAFSVASAGATDKIHGAQEALDRGQISDGEYWKRTGVAVGQTVASYAAGGAAGRAGAQAARGLTSRIAQGAMAGAAGGLGGQAGADAVGVAFGTQEAPSSWQSYAASAGFGAAFGAAAGLKSATTKEVGEYGEKYAADFLERRGYSDVEGVQNASGHGIDLAPTNPQGARRFVEVKTSRGPEAGRLRGAQAKGADAFATSRLQRAAGGARGWQNVDPGVTARARSLRTEVLTSGEARGFVMEITKAGSWNQKLAVRPW